MPNIKSEQLKEDFSLEMNYDQPLSIAKIINFLKDLLGKENCYEQKVLNKNVLFYKHGNKIEGLLPASITYLGGNGQHPIYKKRTQLKRWYKDIVDYFSSNSTYNIRFIGVYHYEGNIVLAEFIKDSYLKKKMNSSAAHVFTNDLFQAMKNGTFRRTDRNNNELVTIHPAKFKSYLDGTLEYTQKDLFSIFSLFNKSYPFGDWISAQSAITQMYENGWNKWKETEWAGWFLEYKMDQFFKENNLEDMALYVGSSHKRKNELDFDLWFNQDNFYGDLKASNSSQNIAPGNDQENFIQCINQYDKFWYVIYEHDTIKDSERDYEATKFRTHYIKDKNEWPTGKPFNELSYGSRMKNSVKFVKMYIVELNKVNYRVALSDFNQGRQPNGDQRKPKFNINKNNIDNFIVYQETFV